MYGIHGNIRPKKKNTHKQTSSVCDVGNWLEVNQAMSSYMRRKTWLSPCVWIIAALGRRRTGFNPYIYVSRQCLCVCMTSIWVHTRIPCMYFQYIHTCIQYICRCIHCLVYFAVDKLWLNWYVAVAKEFIQLVPIVTITRDSHLQGVYIQYIYETIYIYENIECKEIIIQSIEIELKFSVFYITQSVKGKILYQNIGFLPSKKKT